MCAMVLGGQFYSERAERATSLSHSRLHVACASTRGASKRYFSSSLYLSRLPVACTSTRGASKRYFSSSDAEARRQRLFALSVGIARLVQLARTRFIVQVYTISGHIVCLKVRIE
jgi:hypothetical protein